MGQQALIEEIQKEYLQENRPEFHVGDTVSVHTRIVEGDKERIQVFTGTVIARKGSGLSETFSLHRVAYGEGMERVFVLHSPRIIKIEVTRKGKVRQSKLYYLRGTTGKRAKVKERILSKGSRKKASSKLLTTEKKEVSQEEDIPTDEVKEEPTTSTDQETESSSKE